MKLLTTHNQLQTKKGFTIVELLIFMGLLSIILLILTEIFVSVLEVQTESETISSVEQDGRFILGRLMFDINRSQNITTPSNLGDTTDSMQIAIDGINYLYKPDGNNLLLVNDHGANKLNSFDTNISDLSFKRLGNPGGKNTLKIAFTLTSKTVRKSGPEVKIFETTIGSR